MSALVLEAERIGFGGSGRNAGLVNAAAWLPPAKVREALGDTYGPRFVERFSDAPQMVFGPDRTAPDPLRGNAQRDDPCGARGLPDWRT